MESAFSPAGNLVQVDLAKKAVDKGSLCLAIKCTDGVVVAAKKSPMSSLIVKESNKRIEKVSSIDGGIQLAVLSSGIYADARHIVQKARQEARAIHNNSIITPNATTIVEKVATYFQEKTLYINMRPFGVSTVFATYDQGISNVFMIEPSGNYFAYNAIAIGEGSGKANLDLAKLNFSELSCNDAIPVIIQIIHDHHTQRYKNAASNTEYEVEMGWICKDTNGQYQSVPDELFVQNKEKKDEKEENPVVVEEE